MEVIAGNRTYDTNSLPLLCTRLSHSDFDARRQDPTGLFTRLDVYDAGALYLLIFTVSHQRSEDEDDVVRSQGVIPLPIPLGRVIVAHITSHSQQVTSPREDLAFVARDIETVLARLRACVAADDSLADLIHDVEEMRQCLSVGAFRGSLALAGRVLESCLKAILLRHGTPYEDQWMIGTLLNKMADSNIYIDPGMKNVWNIINQQRIVGVHVREAVPIPSRAQAIMVVYAVIDTLQRRLAEDT